MVLLFAITCVSLVDGAVVPAERVLLQGEVADVDDGDANQALQLLERFALDAHRLAVFYVEKAGRPYHLVDAVMRYLQLLLWHTNKR